MAKQIIPVIGVFYDETDFVDDWVRCVTSQNTDELDVFPVIVTNYHNGGSARVGDKVARLRDETGQRIELVSLNTNDGHSHAFNRGIEFVTQEISQAKWITSLDPDARLGKGSIQSMLDRTREVKSCGMVTPIVLRCEKEQEALARSWTIQTDANSMVLHAGHFPLQASLKKDEFPIYWKSRFDGGWSLSHAVKRSSETAPFTPCFCAGLWSTKMIGEIGLVDELQFRTLNCGEFGYRANLRGFSCGLASDAIAFHPKDCTAFWQTDVFDEEVRENRKGNAWHFQHGQALIALKYFPDNIRMKCMESIERQTNWIDYFPSLEGVESYMKSEDRGQLYSSLSE